MNKTVRKIITTILFSMVCMVGMGISSNIARAEVIAVNQDGYYEYKDIDLEGYHYEYIHFKVSNYGTAFYPYGQRMRTFTFHPKLKA